MPKYDAFSDHEMGRLLSADQVPTLQAVNLEVEHDTSVQAAISISVSSFPAIVPGNRPETSSHEWKLVMSPPAAAQLSRLLKQAVKQYLRHSADSDKFEVD